ncbi:hypothetical protein [Azonexus sp. IMCC34839]|uniref:hypothetical protein n=1 Tax=Azonexus sp. IMCC34839 TaxID=3133695 RepID=UPI00399A40BC
MLFRNQIFEHVESKQQVRVLEFDDAHIWIFNLTLSKALPRSYFFSEFKAAVQEGHFVEVETGTAIAPRKYSDAAIRRRDHAHKAIEPLIQNPGVLDAATRGPLVRLRARELGCSEQTIYTYLRTYWRGGQSKQCLTPGFHKIGGKRGETNGRGRPPIYGQYAIYQLTDTDRCWMKEAINGIYLRDKTETVVSAYESLLMKHYSFIDGEGNLQLKSAGECPSETQFRWYLNQIVSKEQKIRARHGDAEFELNHRPIIGSLRTETYTVAQYYEIDATIVDVVLVHEANRAKIIGKPTLYTVRDRKSHLVVGFYSGLENASWTAAMLAIKSIAEDKEALCKKFDVPYSPEDWPAHRCFPQEFIADRGSEMLGDASTQLADGLEITVRNLPSRRADWKPHVECGFKQIQRSLSSLPGYVPPEDFGKRQKYDRSQDAAMTLKEFNRLILLKIIQQNKAPILNNPMHTKHILDGIQPSSINIWNTEIRERAGRPTIFTEAQVRFALLTRAEASVTREGIAFGYCLYSAPEALNYGWFVQAGQGRFKKKISYDKRLVDTIYVHDESLPEGYFTATLQDRCKDYRGLSFDEVNAINNAEKEISHKSKQIIRQLNADFKKEAAPLVAHAVKETAKATKGKTRKARRVDTVEARSDARRIERQESTISGSETPPSPAENSSLNGASSTQQPKSRKQLFDDLLNGK